jgi:hypothetical protein
VASDVSLTSPTVTMPAVASTFRIRVGNLTSATRVLSGSSSDGSNIISASLNKALLPPLLTWDASAEHKVVCLHPAYSGRSGHLFDIDESMGKPTRN